MTIAPSELFLNPDNSVYHLNLHRENIAPDIIFVGDQDRVSKITAHFDSIAFSTQKREFKTETGMYRGKRLSVISTGIGPDNIDIVMNELDAVVNVDLKTRTVKSELTKLNIIRIGTSGALQADIPVDGFVMSKYALGLDNMLRSYHIKDATDKALEDAFINHMGWDVHKGRPYAVKCSERLEKLIEGDGMFKGITATAGVFFGPQGRIVRLPLQDNDMNAKMDDFSYNGEKIINLEMETAAIYGLSALLGHNALSLSAIVANRARGTFTTDAYRAVNNLIEYTLDKLAAAK